MTPSSIRIAVLVPCFNEEAAVATVVADFRKALPSAEIFVYDNNSTDRTIAVARAAGAQVRRCAASAARAKAMWSGACSPISTPTSMCWSMAMRPMTPPARRA
jgi:cellulose synthase/poly-beta-1,6-N-acetylglucosamine synthase-like glycosyltransferase